MQMHTPGAILKQDDSVIELWISEKIESLNKFLPSEMANKRGASETLAYNWQHYKWRISKALQILPMKKKDKCVVNVTIISDRVRLLDLENLWGGAKPLRDTLIKRGYLWDDAPKWGTLNISQRLVKKDKQRTWIKLSLDNTI